MPPTTVPSHTEMPDRSGSGVAPDSAGQHADGGAGQERPGGAGDPEQVESLGVVAAADGGKRDHAGRIRHHG